ncbi:ATP-dependent DNA helicase PIF1-like protein, partial [Tanacetum coccineum]
TDDPNGYKEVTDYMLHGPCVKDGRYAPCITEGKCFKLNPKQFYTEIVLDEDGYPIYRRRDNKASFKKGKFTYDSRHVIIAPCEAVWRLFLFDIHYSYSSVMKLNFHLPNQNPVTLRDSKFLPALLEREGINVTMFTDWFDFNEHDPSARTLTKRKLYDYPELQLSIEQIQNYFLVEIQELLNRNGRSLTDFQDLPRPNPQLITNMDNRHIREALNFDMNKSRIEHERLHPLLNPKQRLIYEHVIHSVHNQRGQFHFVYGPGGTWKTFLYNTIIAKLKTERKIVLAVASSGGRTDHSRFIIPLKLLENNTCGIKYNTHLAELMQEVQLIIWDEAPMTQKYVFEALDKTLRDILGQILPVISKGKRPDVVQACINRSELCSPIENIIAETYPNFIEMQHDDEYLKERAILTSRNDDVDEINTYMFNKLAGKSVTYNSVDEICKASTESLDQQQLYPTEFLNTLNFSGMPPHALCLKKELLIMLLRNVNPTKGLCNGTRLIITELGEFVIHAKILTGSHMGDNVLIHRIITTSNQSKWPFILKRRQYLMKPCYAVTINKSQGQSLNYVGLYLSNPVFSHGQLYVALSRVTNPAGLKILMPVEADPELKNCTRNIVYKETFNNLL